ncbi:MAG: hypothetical protein JWM22_1707, partial [Frankiales bacterium]|nr:hypothetical protein [Frankiales bacterium]
MTNRTAVPMAGRPTRLHALVGATVLASLVA